MQPRVGLHHLRLRARSREDVDRCAALLKEMNATIVRGPMEGPWAPGYVLFEDPDGIRLEVNFVPGVGLLAEGAQFNPGTGHVLNRLKKFFRHTYGGLGKLPVLWSVMATCLAVQFTWPHCRILRAYIEICSAKWQRAKWPGFTSRRSGASRRQRSSANRQRGWK